MAYAPALFKRKTKLKSFYIAKEMREDPTTIVPSHQKYVFVIQLAPLSTAVAKTDTDLLA